MDSKRGERIGHGSGEPDASRPAAPGDVIVLFSGKGGVGKSVIATNLAIALATETKARVALVDLNLQFGDVGVMLALDHSRSITDVVDAGDGLDAEMLNEILATGPAGIRVLLAPISPELADLVNTEHVRTVISELRKSYDYVVVDTSCHLAELNLEVIEMAQRILVITALTIPAIKDAKLSLKVLETLNIDAAGILLVVNRSDGHSDFNRESIEQTLRHSVAVQVPHEPRIVGDAINQGAPFVSTNPDADITRSMRELVGQIGREPAVAAVAAGPEKRRRRGIFGR